MQVRKLKFGTPALSKVLRSGNSNFSGRVDFQIYINLWLGCRLAVIRTLPDKVQIWNLVHLYFPGSGVQKKYNFWIYYLQIHANFWLIWFLNLYKHLIDMLTATNFHHSIEGRKLKFCTFIVVYRQTRQCWFQIWISEMMWFVGDPLCMITLLNKCYYPSTMILVPESVHSELVCPKGKLTR